MRQLRRQKFDNQKDTNHYIIRQGQPATNQIYFLTDGMVKISREGEGTDPEEDSQPSSLNTLGLRGGAGAFFEEDSFVCNDEAALVHRASVQAITSNAEVFVLSRARFNQILQDATVSWCRPPRVENDNFQTLPAAAASVSFLPFLFCLLTTKCFSLLSTPVHSCPLLSISKQLQQASLAFLHSLRSSGEAALLRHYTKKELADYVENEVESAHRSEMWKAALEGRGGFVVD
jgi:CRP-like cAMP-binding protein